MHSFLRSFPLLAVASLLTGCAVGTDDSHADDEGLGESSAAVVAGNGLTYNGLTYNGLTYNGLTYNGLTYNGLTYNGVELGGTQLSGLRLDGALVTGIGFVGSSLTAILSDSTPITLHIDAIEASADPEVYLYTLSYPDGSNVCGQNLIGQNIKAIPLTGRWDYSTGNPTSGAHIDDPSMFTLACVGSTLAKCVQLGYKPWKTVEEYSGAQHHPISGAALHQACVWMIRADYCGDGTAHTQTGTPINLWDNFQIQKPGKGAKAWTKDAEWSAEGAECIANLRHDEGGETTAYINAHCPERWAAPFSCFSNSSTFFTSTGYATPLTSRSLIRNQFDDN